MAEQKKEAENAGEKKSSKKLIIIIVIAVLLLAGGGAAGYYFYFQKGHDAVEAEDGHGKKKNKKDKHDKKKEEEEEEHDEDHPPAELLYHDLGKPLVVDFTKSPSGRFVSISLSFLAEGAETVDALKKNEPMIRNNLLMLINAQGLENLKSREGKEKLRAAILADVSGVLKKMAEKSHVKDVFFTSFVMQ